MDSRLRGNDVVFEYWGPEDSISVPSNPAQPQHFAHLLGQLIDAIGLAQ